MVVVVRSDARRRGTGDVRCSCRWSGRVRSGRSRRSRRSRPWRSWPWRRAGEPARSRPARGRRRRPGVVASGGAIGSTVVAGDDLCKLLGPGDLTAAGVGGAGGPTENNQPPDAWFCVYRGESSATGGIELDVFLSDSATAAHDVFPDLFGEYLAANVKTVSIAGADEARMLLPTSDGSTDPALIGARKGRLTIGLGVGTAFADAEKTGEADPAAGRARPPAGGDARGLSARAGGAIVAPERPVLSSRFGRNRVVVYPRRSFGIEYHEGEQTISRDLRVNQMIRIPQVRVVDEEGAQLGVMPTPRALEMAQERGLDLVEVAPMAAPPVVKFLDFGQYKYDLTKREKEAKRKQRSVTFKEVRLSPKIGTGDFDTKVHRAIEFLEDGDRIKVTVRFRGRELTHPELGRNLLAKFVDRVKEHGVAERTPLLEGKSMHITMASLHKPKVHDAAAPAARRRGPTRRPRRPPRTRRDRTDRDTHKRSSTRRHDRGPGQPGDPRPRPQRHPHRPRPRRRPRHRWRRPGANRGRPARARRPRSR